MGTRETKTIRVRWHLSIGFATANRSDVVEIEVPAGLTPEQEEAFIEGDVRQTVFDYIDWSYLKIENEEEGDDA